MKIELNSKYETLNSKQTQNHKSKTLKQNLLEFEFCILDLFRI